MATKLGTTTHLSPVLQKARRLGLDADDLEHLAIQRGCDYYQDGESLSLLSVSLDHFSNAELAIGLLNPALRYHPQTLRLGAAMLSAEGNRPEDIAWLAELERCGAVVRYIAEAGHKVEPQNEFWTRLLGLLATAPAPKSGVLPHPTRFVAMTGFTRRGVETVAQWIRPTPAKPAHG